MLTQGDVVLAHWGLNTADTLRLYCVQLHVPGFTKGRNQLTALEVHITRELTSVRINVERVIGLVRNTFVFMEAVTQINFVARQQEDAVPPLDKILTASCALCNVSPSVVSPNQKEPVQTLSCPK